MATAAAVSTLFLNDTAQSRASTLRAELKQWEKDFAAANNGRRASKQDIRANGTIAAKYREYEKTKSGQEAVPRTESLHAQTPSKKRKRRPEMHTPRKVAATSASVISHEQALDYTHEDENITATPVHARNFVGPTPKKDGVVLGLFDLLPEKETPTKTLRSSRQALGTVSNNAPHATTLSHQAVSSIQTATPRKAQANTPTAERQATPSATPTHRGRGSRTPQSIGKRFLLSAFAGTPYKRQKLESGVAGTPTRADTDLARGFGTPAFLRRDSQSMAPLPAIAEDAANDSGDGIDVTALAGAGVGSPVARRRASGFAWRRPTSRQAKVPPLRKTLSSMIAEIRREEDKRMDEEMDILREMEMEEEMGPSAPKTLKRSNSEVLVQDSQDVGRLGPDGASQSEAESDKNATAQPRKVWKKKGQKRQTTRVKLRPRAPIKRDNTQQMHSLRDNDDFPNQQTETESSIVLETQTVIPRMGEEESEGDQDSGASSGDEARPKPTDLTFAEPRSKEATAQAKDGVVKKAKRKISATAHANFRKLKIKNKGAGGSKGKKFGRFGRR